jgi:hypothetical protein
MPSLFLPSVCIHALTYVSIRQHTSAYVSIRQHTSAYINIERVYTRSPQPTSVCGLKLLVYAALSYQRMGP